MTDKKFVDLDDHQRRALIDLYHMTVAHHATVVQKYSFGFVGFLVFVNAGALSAMGLLLTSRLGERILDLHPYKINLIIVLFAVGLLASLVLTFYIFLYSLRKFYLYREQLKSVVLDDTVIPAWPGSTPIEPHASISIIAWISLTFSFSFALIGAIVAIAMLLSVVGG